MVFDYEELEPATLKGKAEPVAGLPREAPTARFGTDLTRTHDDARSSGGRSIWRCCKGSSTRRSRQRRRSSSRSSASPGWARAASSPSSVAYVDARPELVTWRQGRCLPYGEGITFWALGEILKAHAGILESDPPEVASDEARARACPRARSATWFRQRLLPLLGIEAASTAEREELFTAWRRFLSRSPERRPTVLVFEDLHWADEAMLAFLEHLADRAEGVPLLAGRHRPARAVRASPRLRGSGSATRRRSTSRRCRDEETARLVSALLETTVLPAELQQPILERAGGNPLYAEEFVRLLKDSDLLVRKGASWELREGAEVPFPDSVQALIAARLDTLRAGARSRCSPTRP